MTQIKVMISREAVVSFFYRKKGLLAGGDVTLNQGQTVQVFIVEVRKLCICGQTGTRKTVSNQITTVGITVNGKTKK